MVRFDKGWFNPLYFILNDIINTDSIRTVLIYGGKGSSKTVSVAQITAKEAYINGASTIGFRKESARIPDTLRESYVLALDSTRLDPGFDIQDRRMLCKNNTSKIVLRGLDKEDKAKGVESFMYIVADELDQYLQSEWEQMDMSLRGKKGQKLFGLWNPIDENSWVKTDLVDTFDWLPTKWKLIDPNSFVKISSDGSTVLIKTTYKDNYWIAGRPDGKNGKSGEYGYKDKPLIAKYERLKTTNYNSYNVNVLGNWGKTVFGGEILKSWKSERDVGVYPYNPELAIYLSFDENVNPYFPCGIFQIEDDQKTATMIHILTMENPDNTVSAMCREIKRLLKQWDHKGRLYVTGDATSQKADVKQEKGYDLFRLIMEALREYKPVRRVPKSNPSVIMSTEFFNSVLDYNAQDLTFRVDGDCKKAIADYENTKEDKNGKVDKKTITHPITKVSYQPFGHIFDLTRYLLVSVFPSEYSKYQSRGVVASLVSGRETPQRRKRF